MLGYIQGYKAGGMILFTVVNGDCRVFDAMTGQEVTSIISATYSNNTITITTTNGAPSRLLVLA